MPNVKLIICEAVSSHPIVCHRSGLGGEPQARSRASSDQNQCLQESQDYPVTLKLSTSKICVRRVVTALQYVQALWECVQPSMYSVTRVRSSVTVT